MKGDDIYFPIVRRMAERVHKGYRIAPFGWCAHWCHRLEVITPHSTSDWMTKHNPSLLTYDQYFHFCRSWYGSFRLEGALGGRNNSSHVQMYFFNRRMKLCRWHLANPRTFACPLTVNREQGNSLIREMV